AEDGIRDFHVTGVQTCALPISPLLQLPQSLPDRGGGEADRLRQIVLRDASVLLEQVQDLDVDLVDLSHEMPAGLRIESRNVKPQIGRASCRERVAKAVGVGERR